MVKAKDMHAKSVEELERELAELCKAQFGLRVQLATQQLNNTAQMRNTRRDIARIKTVLAEKAEA